MWNILLDCTNISRTTPDVNPLKSLYYTLKPLSHMVNMNDRNCLKWDLKACDPGKDLGRTWHDIREAARKRIRPQEKRRLQETGMFITDGWFLPPTPQDTVWEKEESKKPTSHSVKRSLNLTFNDRLSLLPLLPSMLH